MRGLIIYTAYLLISNIGLAQQNSCENFGGTWKGICEFGDKTEKKTVKIDQFNCENIYLDDCGFHIKGKYERANSLRSHFFWNNSRTVANLEYKSENEITAKGSLQKVGEKLYFTLRAIDSSGNSPIHRNQFSCRLNQDSK
ncbi:MAG: hypothetical protein AB8G05_10510 [Oligoflexales bacterium]